MKRLVGKRRETARKQGKIGESRFYSAPPSEDRSTWQANRRADLYQFANRLAIIQHVHWSALMIQNRRCGIDTQMSVHGRQNIAGSVWPPFRLTCLGVGFADHLANLEATPSNQRGACFRPMVAAGNAGNAR